MPTDRKILIISILFFVLGIFCRFYQLGQNPPSLYWDEAAIGIDSYSLVHTGRDINNNPWLQPIFASYGDFKAPVYIWLSALSTKIFELNNFAVRLPAAIFGILLIPLIYIFVKELFSNSKDYSFLTPQLSLFTSVVVAISPWPLHFSRIGFESQISVFWLILCLLFFLKGINKSGLYFLFAGLSGIVGVYTYYALRAVLPLIIAGLTVVYFKEIWEKKWWFFGSLAAFIILLTPLVKSPYYKTSQNYRLSTENIINNTELIKESSKYLERYNSSILAKFVYHRFWFIGKDFLKNYTSHFSPEFLFFSGDRNLRHHSGFGGEFLTIFLPFFLVGLYLIIVNIKQKSIKFIWLFLAISPIAASITYEVPHASRAIYLFIPISIIIAWGLVLFIKHFGKAVFTLGLLSLILGNFMIYYHDYLIHYPIRSSQAFIFAYRQAGEYIKKNYERFSFVGLSNLYWQPQLYVLYEIPELIPMIQQTKEISTKDSLVDLSLTKVLNLLKNLSRENSEEVLFISPKEERKEDKVLERFYFLDGEPSLILIKNKT